MRARQVGGYLLASAIYVFAACGGRAANDGAKGSAGSSGLAGSSSVAGGAAIAGSSGLAGGGNANAGAGAAPNSACLLPEDSGPCEAFFSRYAHDPTTGLCKLFVYGGCEGNDNNFETRDECLAACPASSTGPNYDECEVDTDCAVVSAGCCEACEPPVDENLLAVARKHAQAFEAQRCRDFPPCLPCPGSDEIEATRKYFRGACVNRQCTVQDIRQTPLVECSTKADCRLRAGLLCCEQCDADLTWVAVRGDADFCDGKAVDCPPCGPPEPPADLAADCVAHVCTVVRP